MNDQQIYWQILGQKPTIVANNPVICTGIPSPWMNGVVEDCNQPVDEVIQHFREQDLPFCWWVESTNEQLGNELTKRQVESVGEFASMVLHLGEAPSFPSEVKIVSSDADLHTFVGVLALAYEAPAEIAPSVFQLLKRAGWDFPIFHFLGFENNKAVAAGSLFIHEKIGCIYHIGTIPEARGKGYATLIVNAALNQAKKWGCIQSILTSTPMANSLYRRLGYEEIKHYHLHLG